MLSCFHVVQSPSFLLYFVWHGLHWPTCLSFKQLVDHFLFAALNMQTYEDQHQNVLVIFLIVYKALVRTSQL